MQTTRTLLLNSILIILGACLLVIGCSDDDNPNGPGNTTDFTKTLADFTQFVAIATYADLKDKAAALNTAVTSLNAAPTNQSLLDAAGNAWKATREPWEASEAFLFGPADFNALDPSLDSWPVDRQQLDDVLNSNFALTPEFIAEGLGPALRGFHTVEYLLFREGASRTADDLTAREREFLIASTQVLADDSETLWDGWVNGFGAEFSGAGSTGSRFFSQTDAVLEIIEGIIGIADEVANGKIADPFDQKNVELVESQFSWNSLTDFRNNIRSIQNAYMGGYHNGQDGVGLNEFVNSKDAALDARIQGEITAAITAIGAIPEPFRNNLASNTQIEAAQTAINQIVKTFEENVKPLLNQ